MTKKQQKCLDFIRSYWAEHGMAPLHTEIAAHLGVNPNGVYDKLYRLRDKGLVTLDFHKARSVKPTGACPCCGRVA